MSACTWRATGNPAAHCVACGDPGAAWLAIDAQGRPVEVWDPTPGICGGPELALCKPCIHGLSVAMAAEHFAAEGLPAPAVRRTATVTTPLGTGTLEGDATFPTTGPGKR